jgi:thiosulfate dehydrogenase (quinone) large subunit
MLRRRRPSTTETLDLEVDLRDVSTTDRSLGIPDQPTESVSSRAKRSLFRELRHPAAFLIPMRIFIGVGWLRACAEKAISADWFDGRAVGAFVDSQLASDAVAFPVYRQLIETVLRPGSRWVGWALTALQLLVGIGILLGAYTNLALLLGIVMNANFMLAGQINPSAFYIMIQTVLFVTGAGAIIGLDGSRIRRHRMASSILLVAQPNARQASNGDRIAVAGLAALAGAMSWVGFAYATDWTPTGVSDPALVFGTVMGLGALSLIILRFRLSDSRKQRASAA